MRGVTAEAPSPLAPRRERMFPTLTPEQIARVAPHGKKRKIARGEVLVEAGHATPAFIVRRVELIARGFGDVVLLGSSYSPGTLRVKEFLSRNGHPYNYVDLDRDSGVQELLDRFRVKAEEIPVVVCRGETVLRDPSN